VTGSVLDRGPVIPVVVVEEPDCAAPLARALLAGGVGTIEVTLRTERALDAVARIRAEVPDILVGAGTILGPGDATEAVRAGAQFLVSPGTTPATLDAMLDSGVPVLPGAASLSEVMVLTERGVREIKFFPAEASGGVNFLRAASGPLPAIRFCPTGGVSQETAPRYLALPNVGCVGGTWLAPVSALAARDWPGIERRARHAASLTRASG
jgi:2-dehydro-3-deoxyphosphogluconate aldolase/(4S)-4-hydroxy-2-oxoglutarate aldolase